METKTFHVKKLENPDFFDLRYKGKKMIIGGGYSKFSKFPADIYIGEVKQFDWGKEELYLSGFSMTELTKYSQLEKQIIFGGKYCGDSPHYGIPLTTILKEKYTFYEFKGDVNINELRNIANGKEKIFEIIEEN